MLWNRFIFISWVFILHLLMVFKGGSVASLLLLCRDKITELYEWMRQLESEKFEHMERLKRQKYEVRARLHTKATPSSPELPRLDSVLLYWLESYREVSQTTDPQTMKNIPTRLPWFRFIYLQKMSKQTDSKFLWALRKYLHVSGDV